jgi:hypothetical protein
MKCRFWDEAAEERRVEDEMRAREVIVDDLSEARIRFRGQRTGRL